MATQRRFEADTLAEVLAKVQEEVGPDAKIASAQKVRSGGAFGFFQKERFEVLVDIPDPVIPVTTTATAPTISAPTASAKSAMKHQEDNTDWLLELAQEFNQEEKRRQEPAVSTESNEFADVLSRVAFQADMGHDDEEVVIPGRPSFLDEQHEEETPEPEEEESIDDEPETIMWSTPEPAPQPIPEPQPVEPPQPSPIPEPLPDPIPAVAPVAETPVETVIAQPLVPTPLTTTTGFVQPQPEPEPEPVVDITPVVHEQAEMPVRTRITDHPLHHLGLPGAYIPTEPDIIDLRAALTDALRERLPRTPVVKPSRGSIIAVVGSREDAEKLAADLAHEFGRPKEEVILATQHTRATVNNKILGTIEAAEDAQRAWSRRQRPTIVAIEAKPGGRDTSWAEHVLTALEPIATFGVIDATRKAEDLAAWADELGGIDCLAINNIEETVSPAACLQAGIPVERIDGRKATPEFWAILLTERLPAA